jgi:hypothetical protein
MIMPEVPFRRSLRHASSRSKIEFREFWAGTIVPNRHDADNSRRLAVAKKKKPPPIGKGLLNLESETRFRTRP